MALILSVETATKTCSVSLAKDGRALHTLTHFSEKYSHSERLNTLILQLFSETGYELKNLDAVAVSEGPGSYTGLRIGTSTAKGLCYALDIPMIAINSLRALASLKVGFDGMICPMFDARRMEVYSAVFSEELVELEKTNAVVIDAESYLEHLDKGKVCFLGPGAEKCQEMINHPNAFFDLETTISAVGMVDIAEEKFNDSEFVDLAYFEPFYLKDFIAGKPKKLL